MRPIGLLIAITLFFSGCSAAVLQEPAPSITVIGTATAPAPPDTAEVTAGVVTQAPTAAQALTQNSAAMERVLRAVSGLGIAARDVRTSGVNVMPQRAQPQPGRPVAPGHRRLRGAQPGPREGARTSRWSADCSTCSSAQGANTLGGMTLSVADPAPLLTEARTRAIADARRKAEVYATAAGVEARPRHLHSRRDRRASAARWARMMAAQAAVPIAPGEQELEVSVSVTYGIE